MRAFSLSFCAVFVTTAALFTASSIATAQPYPGLIAVNPATTLQLETGSVDIKAIASIPGGGAYIAGDFQRVGSMRHVSLVRLKEDGSLDTSFAGFDTRHTAGLINALLLQPDGKLVVGGYFGPIGGRNHLVRLNPDGSLDTTFATNGVGNMVYDLKATPTGKILATGNFENYYSATGESVSVSRTILLNSDGSRDPSFIPPSTDGNVLVGLPLADGGFLIGGEFKNVQSTSTGQLARLNADGSLDSNFAIGGGFNPASSFQIYALNQQSDGKIIVGGNFSAYAGNSINGILRLTSAGQHDLSFNPFLSGTVRGIVVASDDSLRIAGSFSQFIGTGGFNQPSLAKLSADGVPDSSFRPDIPTRASWLHAVALDSNDNLWTGGRTGFGKTAGLLHVNALDGSIITTSPPVLRRPAKVYATARMADGTAWLGGDFHYANDQRVDGLVQIASDGTIANPALLGFVSDQIVYTLAADQTGGLIVGGSFSSLTSAPGAASYLVRLKADGTLDPDFANASSSPNFSGIISNRVERLTIGPDGKIVIIGPFFNVGGITRPNVARLLADGRIDSSFNVGPTGVNYAEIKTVSVDSANRIYFGGTFTSFAGQTRSKVVRLSTDGTVDLTYPNLPINGGVLDLLVDGSDRLVVAGGISFVGSTFTPRIARFLTDGTLDGSFGAGANIGFSVNKILEQADGKLLVGGSFTSSNSTFDSPYLMRVLANGDIDPTFAAFNLNGTVENFALLTGGNVIVGGDTRFVNVGLTETATAPSITTEPVAATAVAGGAATFAVGLTGSAPLTYSWYRDGKKLAVANTPSLTLSNIDYQDLGHYQLVVTNPLGEASSAIVALTSNDPAPVITGQPQPQTPGAGTAATLSVGVTGSGFTYVWRRNGVPIPNATGPSLVINHASLVDEGLYDVVVINGLSSTVSTQVPLRVNPVIQPGFVNLESSQTLLAETTSSTVRVVVPLADGRAYVGGDFGSVNGGQTGGVVRLQADGTIDPSFNLTGVEIRELVGMVLQADGKLVIGGNLNASSPIGNHLIRLNLDGTVDGSFGNTGVNSNVTALAATPDGRLIVAGNFSSFLGKSGTVTRDRLVILNADGTLHPGVTFPSITGNPATAILSLADGGFLLGGSFTGVDGQSIKGLVRFNAAGTRDTTFTGGTSFGSSFPSIHALKELADGSLLIGGNFYTFAGQTVSNFMKLSASGELDQDFSGALGTIPGSVYQTTVLGDGSILIAGSFGSINGSTRPRIALLDSTGALSSTVPDAALAGLSAVYGLALASDGSIWLGSNTTKFEDVAVHRISSSLAPVTHFTPPTVRGIGHVYTSLIMPQNQLLIGGQFNVINGQPTHGLALLDEDGAVIKTFDLASNSPIGDVQALLRQSDGSILVGGSIYAVSGGAGTGNYLVRLRPDGTLDPTFATASSSPDYAGGFNSSVRALGQGPDGSVFVGGLFSIVQGAPRQSLVKLDRNGRLDASFNLGSTGVSSLGIRRILVDASNRVYVAGTFTSFAGQTRAGVVRLHPDGSLDTTFPNLGFNSWVDDMLFDQQGRLVVAGQFTSSASGSAPYIARFSADGVRDTTFSATAQFNSFVRSIHLQSDGKILASGDFTTVYSQPNRRYLVRFNTDGTLDPTFVATGLSKFIDTLTLRDDGRLFVGAQQGGRSGLTEVAFAPSITTPPQSQSVSAHATVTLTMTAAGTAPLAYQWYQGNSALPGATTSTFEIANLGFADLGDYSVEVTNAFGSVRSAPASLTAGDPVPVITTQPMAVTSTVGEPTTLSVTATGDALTYQWRLNGFAIPGATSTTFTLPSTSLADAGTYDVQIFNGLAATTSASARLTAQLPTYPDLYVAGDSTRLRLEAIGGTVDQILPLPNGQVYVAGNFAYFDHAPTGPLMRLNANGSRDSTFQFSDSQVVGSVSAIALQSDGKLIIGGSFSAPDGRTNLVRLNSDGSVDTTFLSKGFNSAVTSLDLLTDGRILVGGWFTSYYNQNSGSTTRNRVALLNADGSLDASFAPALNSQVFSVLGLADGGFLVGGYFNKSDDADVNYLARYHSDGSLDTTFAPGGGFAANTFPAIHKLTQQPDGKILIGGNFSSYGGVPTGRLIRIASTGTLDVDFNTNLGSVSSTVYDIKLDASGSIFVAGGFSSVGSTPRYRIAKLNSNGALDQSFAVANLISSSFGKAMGISTDSTLWLGITNNGQPPTLLKTTSASGDPATLLPAVGIEGTIATAISLPDNRVMAAGTFSFVNGQPASGLLVLASDATIEALPDLGWSGIGYVYTLLRQGDGGVLVGGQFTGQPTQSGAANHLLRLRPDLTLDPTFAPAYSSDNYAGGLSANVTDLAQGPDGSFLAVGNFTTIAGKSRTRIARFLPDGRLDEAFNATDALDTSIFPSAVLVDSAGRIVVGSNNRVTRLTPTGTADSAFANVVLTGGSIYDLVFDADEKIVVAGGLSTIGGNSWLSRVARLTADGQLDPSFPSTARIGSTPDHLTVQPDGKILVAGSFNATVSNVPSRYLVRLNSDGTQDSAFQLDGINRALRIALLRDDGSLFLGGTSGSFSGVATVGTAPSITADLTDQTAGAGDSVTFTVSAEGSGDLTYRWYHNGALIAGADASTYTVASVTPADGGDYWVVVNGAFGEVRSATVGLTGAVAPPTVSISPNSLNATVGDNVTFNVVSDSTSATYQWLRNGTPIDGATGTSFTLNGVRLTDADRYDVRVSDGPSLSQFSTAAALLRVFPAAFPTAVAPNPDWTVKLEGGDTKRRLMGVFPLPDGGGIVIGNFASFEGHKTANSARINAGNQVEPAYVAAGFQLPYNYSGQTRMVMDGAEHFVAITTPTGFQSSGTLKSTVTRFDLQGRVDESFNLDAELTTTFDHHTLNAIAVDNSRRVLIAWSHYNSADQTHVVTLTRALPSGTWDKSFPSLVFNQLISKILPGSDNSLLIGGAFTELNGNPIPPIIRIDASGSPDAVLAANLSLPPFVDRTFYLPLHRTEAGDIFLTASGRDSTSRFFGVLDHVSADGTLIRRWELDNPAFQVNPLPDGSILVFGAFSMQGDTPLRGIGKIDAAGSLTELPLPYDNYTVESFDASTDGTKAWMQVYDQNLNKTYPVRMDLSDGSINDWTPTYAGEAIATAIEPLANGEWLVAGDFSSANGVPTSNMVRLDSTGQVVGTYGDEWGPDGGVFRLQRRSDGKINIIASVYRPGLLLYRRLNADGTVDSTFVPELNTNNDILLMLDLPAGKTLLTSWFLGFENNILVTSKRLLPDGKVDPTFPAQTMSENPAMAGLLQQDGGHLLGRLGNATAVNLSRYTADGGLDSSYGANAGQLDSVIGFAPSYDNSDWVFGYYSITRLSAEGTRLASIDSVTPPTLSWTSHTDFPITKTVALPDGDMLVANFLYANFGGAPLTSPVARLNPDLTWDTADFTLLGVDQEVTALRLTDSGNLIMAVPGRIFMTRDASSFTATVAVDTGTETLLTGQAVTFTVNDAPPGDLTFQWRKDGQPLTGATSAALTLTGLTTGDAGNYDVVIGWALGEVTARAYTLNVETLQRALTNFTGHLSLPDRTPAFLPFRIEGTGTKQVLLRAVGPTLVNFDETLIMPDPQLRLLDATGALIAENDNWGNDTALATAASTAGAFALNTDSADAALLASLAPGNYILVVAGESGGTVLIELYDIDGDGSDSRLVHAGLVGHTAEGGDTMVSGFVNSRADRSLLVRAVGPGTGLINSLADPQLAVFVNGTTSFASNDNWGGTSTLQSAFVTAGASPLSTSSPDAAYSGSFPAGSFTLSSVPPAAQQGRILVEVFDLLGRQLDPKPALLVPAQSQRSAEGGTVRFEILATGSPSLTYQWNHDNTPLGGETAPGLNLTGITTADAGFYTVTVTNSAGSITSAPAELIVGSAPLITHQPHDYTLASGSSVTLHVEATSDTRPLVFQWYEGASGDESQPITGATSARFTTPALTVTTNYWVLVSSLDGDTASATASLTVLPVSGLVATHEVVGGGYHAGRPVTINNTFTFDGTVSSLGWSVFIPSGWAYVSSSGAQVPDLKPVNGDTGTLGWAFTSLPSNPVNFSYTLMPPTTPAGHVGLSGVALYRGDDNPDETVVVSTPSPLMLTLLPSLHTADTNQDGRISLTELLRVIELYNTRFGTSRTGRYQVSDGSTDGFAPDASINGSTSVTLTRYHAADTDRDGLLNLSELLRVIEIYNYRSGTTRTGEYHPDASRPDGVSPGPGS